MPNGYGYAVNGKPDPKANRVLARVTPPGADATKEVEAATRGIQRLAAADGHRLEVSSDGGSETRDRITIAAAATAGIAVIAAIALYRRQRKATRAAA
jgi:MoxR-like ATPase